MKRCKTDTFDGLQFGDEARPECSNLMTIYQLATGQSKVWKQGGDKGEGEAHPSEQEGGWR